MTASVPSPETPRLHSELAQYCLPAVHKERNQKLAWVNSICLLYMVIGLVGLKPPVPVIKVVLPLEQPVNIPIEAPPVQIQTTQDKQEEEPQDSQETSDAPAIVAVTVDSPALSFSVPTVGNVLVAASAAQAPPPKPMQTAPRLDTKPIVIRPTRGGNYPMPSYPQDAMRAGLESEITLRMTVDANGTISDVTVLNSRGYQPLIRHTIDHVKKRFMFPADGMEKRYDCTFLYPKMT